MRCASGTGERSAASTAAFYYAACILRHLRKGACDSSCSIRRPRSAVLSLPVPCLHSRPRSLRNRVVLQPDRVFDGESMRTPAGSSSCAASASRPRAPRHRRRCRQARERSRCTGTTLMPGMIEGHSHLLLHPYNETDVERSGAARAAGAARRARRQSRARDLDGRHHDRSRSRHRRRRLCRRRTAPGDQRRHRSRPAHARGRTGDGRHRQLRAERASRRR